MTNLDALNIVLDAIGVYPVTSYNSPQPDAVRARQNIERFSAEIQTRGWYFNRDWKITLLPDIDGHILIPSDVLVVDSSDPTQHFAKRGGRMYDPANHTYVFTAALTVDMITELPFDECPISIQTYIARSSALEMAVIREGDQNKIKVLNGRVMEAKSAAYADEIRNSNYNVFNTGLVSRVIQGNIPAIRRR